MIDFFEEHEPEIYKIYENPEHIRRTNICIVFEEIYKMVIDIPESNEKRQLIDKIVEGYFMGKKMSNKISFYKGEEERWQQALP